MEQAFLGLGSNVGKRERYLGDAVEAIANLEDTELLCLSSIYETEPWGRKDQQPFLNQVVAVETGLGPEELLSACQEIERSLGQRRAERWGPRTMDIDLLLYGEKVVEEETLRVPHPRLLERRFVLVPLEEIAPSLSVPGSGKTVGEVLATCADRGRVEVYRSVER